MSDFLSHTHAHTHVHGLPQSITKLSQYIQYQAQLEPIADVWLQVFIRSSPESQLILVYL